MELQTIFNQVCQHLVRQGRAAMEHNTGGSCRYRGACGTRCAVGYLIADKHYDNHIEGGGMARESVQDVVIATIGDISDEACRLLAACQNAHDVQLADVSRYEWARRMIYIAEVRDLIVPKQVRELARG